MNFINLTKVICIKRIFKDYRNILIFRQFRSDMAHQRTTIGVEKHYIRGSEEIYGAPEFERVQPSETRHAVMYEMPRAGYRPGYTQLFPFTGHDPGVWDDNHVRMPFSPSNQQKVKNKWHQDVAVPRWEIIKEALTKVENRQIRNIDELAAVIFTYNPKYAAKWKFTALHALYAHLAEDEREVLFYSTLPAIANLALKLPDLIKTRLPLLKQNWSASVSMTQEQVSSLLANAFFCTFPWRNTDSQSDKSSAYKNYPNINFWRLFNADGDNDVLEKLKCILHYFRRVSPILVGRPPVGVLTFSRRCVPDGRPNWGHSRARVGDVWLHVDPQLGIELQDGLIQLDFANKYLGGGVLGRGSVQEEIRFSVSPELMASMLFVEKMNPGEAVMIIGAERYSQYIGYSRSFTWMDDYRDDAAYDSSGRRRVAVLAIDAMPFKKTEDQYIKTNLDREINKAWIGFSSYTDGNKSSAFNFPGVATGNWGCGAFGGSPPLKALIQLMACAEARRHLAYVTFGDEDFSYQLIEMYECLARNLVTVGQLYGYILDFGRARDISDLFRYLFSRLGEENTWEYNNERRSERQQRKNSRHRRSAKEQSNPTTSRPQSKL